MLNDTLIWNEKYIAGGDDGNIDGQQQKIWPSSPASGSGDHFEDDDEVEEILNAGIIPNEFNGHSEDADDTFGGEANDFVNPIISGASPVEEIFHMGQMENVVEGVNDDDDVIEKSPGGFDYGAFSTEFEALANLYCFEEEKEEVSYISSCSDAE